MRGGGGIAKHIKKKQDFHAMNIITLLTPLQYQKRLFFCHIFFALLVVGNNASHSLQEIEDIEKAKEMCSAVKKLKRLPTPNGNDIKVR